MAGIAGILGRFSSVVKRRKLNDGSLKGGGALRRRKPNTHTAGRKSQSSQWGGGVQPILHVRVRRRLPTSQGTALLRRHYSLNCAGLDCAILSRFGSRASVRLEIGESNAHSSTQEKRGLGHHDRRTKLHYQLPHHDIFGPRENIEAMNRLLFEQYPKSRREAAAGYMLSMAGKWWSLTYVFRAGGYSVWTLMRLTGLQNSGGYTKPEPYGRTR